MNRQKGNVILLLLIGTLLVAAVAAYFYSQGTNEEQQQQRAIKFTATEEAKDLMTLDKASHKWLGLWASEAKTKRNYERIIDYDTRYEIPIAELIEKGLLVDGFANRYGGGPVSVYGLPYTTSVIKRAVNVSGTYRQCVAGSDPIGDCESPTGGVCTPYNYTTGQCRIAVTEDKFSILTTIGTKGIEIPPEAELVCPIRTEYMMHSSKHFLVNAPGHNELQLKGSCTTHFPMGDWSGSHAARGFVLSRVNNMKSARLTNGATEITLNAGNNESLRCRLGDSYYAGSHYTDAEAFVAPDYIDSVVVCEVIRPSIPQRCETHLSYCSNGTNQPITNPADAQPVNCSASTASSQQDRLNRNDSLAWRPYSDYLRDGPWSCSVTSSSRLDCYAEYQCSGTPPVGGNCPAFLNYTKNGTLMIDKDQFATYPRACDPALEIQAAGEVAGHYSTYSPALKWDNGPVCGIAPGGTEIICSGSENDGGPPGNVECEVYKYETGGTIIDHVRDYPGQTCYD